MRLAKMERVVGINSLLRDGEHILLWDFDEMSLPMVEGALLEVQHRFGLPDIYILRSNGEGTHYHAYCFERVTIQEAVRIIASTRGIDLPFLAWGILRGYFTLRAFSETREPPELVKVLRSPYEDSARPDDLLYVSKYWARVEKGEKK